MTFQELRRTALQANALSTSFFAETVTIIRRNGDRDTIAAKCEYDQRLPRRTSGGGRGIAYQQTDTTQRLRVMVSRETNWDGLGIENTPDVGTQLIRAATVDADTRPWVFAGDIFAQGDLSATYIFERAKRPADDRRVPQQ